MRKPLATLFVSMLFFSGVPWLCYYGYKEMDRRAKDNLQFMVRAIVPVTKNGPPLQGNLFSEFLGLSSDKPSHLFRLSIPHLEEKLSQLAVFKKVKIDRIRPSLLRVEVEMREPLFRLISQENTLVDKEGVLFPEFPFLTPKRVVEIVLSHPEVMAWGTKIPEEEMALLQEVTLCCKKNCALRRIDLSKKAHASLGQREIVLQMGSTYYRLPATGWLQRMGDIQKISDLDSRVVDLRIEDIALIRR